MSSSPSSHTEESQQQQQQQQQQSSPRYWCYTCNAEVPIYMAPDPTCQRCNDQFIEEVIMKKLIISINTIMTIFSNIILMGLY